MDVNRIRNTVIFKGMSEAEIADALAGLNAMTKKYKKGLAILHAGSVTNRMGLVLEGSVTIENNDVWGNKTILTHVGKDHFFAETYGLLADEPLLVDVEQLLLGVHVDADLGDAGVEPCGERRAIVLAVVEGDP